MLAFQSTDRLPARLVAARDLALALACGVALTLIACGQDTPAPDTMDDAAGDGEPADVSDDTTPDTNPSPAAGDYAFDLLVFNYDSGAWVATDTQGDINHGTLRNGGMNVLFFDSHVEFRMNTELDLKHAVGDARPDALLTELSN